MSQFNKKLEEARARQKRFYLAGGCVGIIFLALVIIFFVISRGTRVEISPEEAQGISTIRVAGWNGFSIGETVYSLMGYPLVMVSAPGFQDATEQIDSLSLGRVFPVILKELPGRLIIELTHVESDPTMTSWLVNGSYVGRSPTLDIERKAGLYEVTIDHQFYQQKKLNVELQRGEETRLETSLIPVDGLLKIQSYPTESSIYINGKEVGKTPLNWVGGGGRYSIRVSSENYSDTVDDVEITRSESTVVRNYKLALKQGTVVFDLRPKGGRLLVDGVIAEPRLDLDAGVQHTISYAKAGYYPEKQMVEVAADEEKEVVLTLKEEVGDVVIQASPSATIWIGAKNYGPSPVTAELRAIEHTISFKKDGYRTVVKKVRPKGGTSKNVSAKLLTEYQARLKEALPEYTAYAGIRMKLFRVNDTFTMGAPRSQKGQRANEILREVRLSKPFYVSAYEITQAQFSKFQKNRSITNANAPATSISWEEAATFCNWLSAKEGFKPFYSIVNGRVVRFDGTADGYRMLTEAEWEWLARKAGKRKQTIFSWGNETTVPKNAANIADESAKGQVRFYVPQYNDGYSGEAPVGRFTQEPSGLYDMSGNVSEWVHDTYSIVPEGVGSTLRNPLGSARGQSHVVKGANWSSGTITNLRPSFREGITAGRSDVGFRIARYLYGGEK